MTEPTPLFDLQVQVVAQEPWQEIRSEELGRTCTWHHYV